MKRVDEVPFYLMPVFWLYGKLIGGLFYAYCILVNKTSSIQITGNVPKPGEAVIYCIWHEDLVPYFSFYYRVSKQVWMNHPIWYMKPVHELLYLTGVEHICLGSSGNNGKTALQQVVSYLKMGYSTTVACDGPAGPAHIVKPGVLMMAQQSGLPIVPVRFSISAGWRLTGWDRKKLPILFGTINVHYMPPIKVEVDHFSVAQEQLTHSLSAGL